MKIGRFLKRSGLGNVSVGEYQANLRALNVFFGAVLGLALVGTEKLDEVQFGLVLTILAAAVAFIMYISSSRNRVMYSIAAFALSFVFPELIDFVLDGKNVVPDKIRPTLVVWTSLTILVEFWSREKDPATPT